MPVPPKIMPETFCTIARNRGRTYDAANATQQKVNKSLAKVFRVRGVMERIAEEVPDRIKVRTNLDVISSANSRTLFSKNRF